MEKKKMVSLIIMLSIFIIILISLFLARNLLFQNNNIEINQNERINEIIPEEQRGYYGFSTFGRCQENIDCKASGCNSEICQSNLEEERLSICIYPDAPTPLDLNYVCQCIENQCQWAI